MYFACPTNKSSFESLKVPTQVHVLILWEEDNSAAKERALSYLRSQDSSRLLEMVRIPKENIHRVLSRVSSGGFHTRNDVEALIVEVPGDEDTRKTHDHPNGELVNRVMYDLKTAARGKYSNYRVAHGSFNKKEAEEFFHGYFPYLGPFKDVKDVLVSLARSNIFWFYDRVNSPTEIGDVGGDIDLVVDSIPATAYFLRDTGTGSKLHPPIENLRVMFDLQDFRSGYYPEKWLEDIRKRGVSRKCGYFITPNLLDHFMLGLYHMYKHKGGKQGTRRLALLDQMARKLGEEVNESTLEKFLTSNDYGC